MRCSIEPFRFFPGLHQPNDAEHFAYSCISINRLWRRLKPVSGKVLVDSAAFTEVSTHGGYRYDVWKYASRLFELHSRRIVDIAGVVSQDYMCEAFILEKTGLTVEDHQRLTIERYDELVRDLDVLFGKHVPFPVMPVLQGACPDDYERHLKSYGDRLKLGMWVGVGSVCKLNGNPDKVFAVLNRIKRRRPDLRLHGFGVKITALTDRRIVRLLSTADSMAWSDAAKKEHYREHRKLEKELGLKLVPSEVRAILAERGIYTKDANDWREAMRFAQKIEALVA